jgi:hypothetical protein
LRPVTNIATAHVRCTAITVDAILLAKRFANVRPIVLGRPVARLACAGIGCATKSVYAFLLAARRAESGVGIVGWIITVITGACVRVAAESIDASHLTNRFAHRSVNSVLHFLEVHIFQYEYERLKCGSCNDIINFQALGANQQTDRCALMLIMTANIFAIIMISFIN